MVPLQAAPPLDRADLDPFTYQKRLGLLSSNEQHWTITSARCPYGNCYKMTIKMPPQRQGAVCLMGFSFVLLTTDCTIPWGGAVDGMSVCVCGE